MTAAAEAVLASLATRSSSSVWTARYAEVKILQKALVLEPQNVDLLYLLGHAYERLGKDEVVALEKAAPGSARAEQLLGESYSASSEWPSAVLRFQNALAASASTPGVHVELGEVLLPQGKLKRAGEEFAEELRLNPDSLRGIVRRGEVRLIQGDVDGALGPVVLDQEDHALVAVDLDPLRRRPRRHPPDGSSGPRA